MAAPASSADVLMRRLLRVASAPGASAGSAERLFGQSVAISAVRCLLTYIVIPVLAPVVGLTTGAGPVLGLLMSVISSVAIVVSMRRFWAAGHRWRWGYTAIGGGILVLLLIQAIADVAVLAG